jgi:hypothetical protein
MLITAISALVVFLAVIGIDIFWAADHVPGNTFSEVINFLSRYAKLLPFAGGVLGGHLWHLDMWALPRSMGIPLMLWLAVVAEVISLATPTPMFCYLVFGVVVGMICWPV